LKYLKILFSCLALLGLLGVFLVSATAPIRPLEKTEGSSSAAVRPAIQRIPGGAPLSRAPASVPAPSPAEGKVPPILSFVRKNFPGEWVANYSDSGQLNGITGGSIPRGATDPGRAYALAVELAKLQGVRQEDLESRNRFKGESEVQSIYEFQQTYQGYTVFGSSIRLNAAKGDGTVYHVSTSLAEIQGGDFVLGIQKDAVSARIQSLYPGRTISQVTFSQETPVIWARSEPQELAWVVTVGFRDPKVDRIRVILGSKTGEIRGEQSQLME
jgi:hypothetical protein